MTRFLYVCTIIGSVIAGVFILVGLLGAKSAPQEAASFAGAVAFAVVPYVLARASQLFGRAAEEERRHAALLAALKDLRAAPVATAAPAPATTPAAAPTTAGPKARGECPNCHHVNDMDAAECENCRALFRGNGGWKLRPLA